MTFTLITGASKGIGKAIAEELGKRQHNLLLIARSEKILQEQVKKLSGLYKIKTDYLAIDLSAPGAPEDIYNWCVEKNYSVDILVNNAGYGLSGSLDKYDEAENINMMQLNMITPVHLCQLFLPMLRQQQKSYILNIASSAAYQAVPYLSIYAATKAFILNFSRGLRQELKKTAVSVTCISPGATDTEFVVRAKIGEKGLKAANKLNMTPETVATIAVNAMFAGKAEVITGFVNKLGAFFAWLLPKGFVEKTAMKMYE
ncbi:MAG: SDR family oxidoreductase [Bacteroidetes bacterium]|nr:SDR family oxidoreductase [Bacteroidota bacterium]